ncbi:MAG: phosphoribosylformylglycinamidine synthase subunit PurQ [Rhodobiaceae bacterium]|nr:phosphoribosylformylglycinamidine synthase subunit PurQ [Paracoccaceae bacterium]MCB1472216.1 phosphoribosylformylglycinamidine synthase subunit PurQ [Rhodobiaceae bacterium]
MKSAIILFPGTNRERDMAAAIKRASGNDPLIVWHGETSLPDVDLIVLPGGFSYGDYLRCGAIAANSPVMPEVIRRAKAGTFVLGVCNGFQMLTETGLLPGALMRNASLSFVCRDVHLKVENTQTPFTSAYSAGQVIRVPVAHGDGNYFADTETLDRLEGEGRVVVRYCDGKGAVTDAANPNGSQRGIAGILNQAGNVLGMMPHPEDMTDIRQGGLDGLPLFTSIASAA